jgi:hypothetical protein
MSIKGAEKPGFRYMGDRIREANSRSLERLLSTEPVLSDVDTALSVIPGMTPDTILHAGPPVTWQRMCDAMNRAVRGALIFEGLASDDKSAEALINENKTLPQHDHDAGPDDR